MHIDEPSLLEELVDRVSREGADPKYGLEGVGPGPQMGDSPQVLETVPLLLQRVVRRGSALHLHGHSLDLKGLLRLGRGHKRTFHDDGSSHVQFGDLREVLHAVMVHHLQRLKEGSVVHHDEPECLGVADAAHPASHSHFPVQVALCVLI